MVIRKRFISRDSIRLYGSVEEIVEAAKLSDRVNPYSRTFIILDCILANAFEDGVEAVFNEKNLSLVRIMSTPRRLEEDFNLTQLDVGDWVEFELNDSGGLPVAMQLLADDDYQSKISWSAKPIKRISRGMINDNSGGDVTERIAELYSLEMNRTSIEVERSSLPTLIYNYIEKESVEIIIKDVGQASLTEIWSDGLPVFMFDVGEPTNFNKKSANPNFVLQWSIDHFIILSHWDWDHFNLGRRKKQCHDMLWFAPNQPVSANVFNFQRKLGERLVFIHGNMSQTEGFSLRNGLSSDPSDRNNTGYQLKFEFEDDAVLLTGDTDYEYIDSGMKTSISALSIPHHGGKGSQPPTAIGEGKAAVSYGLPNYHRHPVEEQLEKHEEAGWSVQRTAEPQRKDITLYPL